MKPSTPLQRFYIWLWKMRYAILIKRATKIGWKYAWVLAHLGWGATLDAKGGLKNALAYAPNDAVNDELECWG
jgi:hypothetical protein